MLAIFPAPLDRRSGWSFAEPPKLPNSELIATQSLVYLLYRSIDQSWDQQTHLIPVAFLFRELLLQRAPASIVLEVAILLNEIHIDSFEVVLHLRNDLRIVR
ncbi:uncharacterized protein An07g05770 [Aspergillus niger]|uniref:Contig An07c0160, genomic contig n=2 Tax=Aspergillus niger TaxID=5061 RepID=E2PSP1_ASPNC|nr:uncharacterized protein An07g05770 [Aspergillus niger]CAK48948.1 unnamed protein product [Aspergillus niger]